MKIKTAAKIHKKLIVLALAAMLIVACTFSWGLAPAWAESSPQSDYIGRLYISELMVKNHATLTDERGERPDYIELVNVSHERIELEGFRLCDGEDKEGWAFPQRYIAPGEYLLIYADNTLSIENALHSDFAISYGETVVLRDSQGFVVDKALCDCDTADIALVRHEDGQWAETLYPSPGQPNSPSGYDIWQESLFCASALIINEAMVFNDSYLKQNQLGYCDWLEIKNVSDKPVELSDYCLSDDDDALTMWRFPARRIKPGECISVICDDSTTSPNPGQIKAPFNLSAERERLYLSHVDGSLSDYVFLRDIPYGCSYGRATGENGWFFFDSPSPGEDNGAGYRRVSASPVSMLPDGVFDNGPVRVEIKGSGEIYYTLDGTVPTTASIPYTGPFNVEETTIVRAICVEDGALPSRTLTLSYIIGEGHTLPVLSLVTDDADTFWYMYNNRRKDMEVPGSLSLYEPGGSFTVPGGIEMHGEKSLEMPKKNMSVKLSGAYGQDTLHYDAFGGGVTEFTDFVLRSGQDFLSSIVRNELLENLCMQYSQSVPSQRSKHCVMYINGEYSGLYVLMEKLNEQHYANLMGVSEDSVTVIKARAPFESAFYQEVIVFAQKNDLTKDEVYERFCQIVDIDSLIDWIIIEGYSANSDIHGGNVRYCRSTEGDGKWRFMLYDMDSTMSSPTDSYKNVLTPRSTQCADFIVPLMKNEKFADCFLTRANEVLKTTLSDENVVAELDRLSALIRPEVERDYKRFGMTLDRWEAAVRYLRDQIIERKWSESCEDSISMLFKLTDDEKEHYFGG